MAQRMMIDFSPEQRSLEGFVESLPLLSPKEIFRKLEDHGYRGQDRGRKAISLMAYRHVKRLKSIFLEGVKREKLPPKTNYLLMGPTGCGKTFLVELLFQKILQIPTVIVDITCFTESGYVGDDVRTILTRLILSAGGDPKIASCGVVCLDEFDKIATAKSSVRFAGEGTTKDVSGLGVQRELLKMLEGSDVAVPLDFGYSSFGDRLILPTVDIPFLACGAFSGFKYTSQTKDGEESIGFRRKPKKRAVEKIAYSLEDGDIEDVETFQVYGFLPELIARFTRIVPFDPLGHDILKSILKDNVIGRYAKEFEQEGLELHVSSSVIDHLISQALKKQTGARGLNSLLTIYLEEAAFSSFATEGGKVRVELKNGEVITRVEAPSKSRSQVLTHKSESL